MKVLLWRCRLVRSLGPPRADPWIMRVAIPIAIHRPAWHFGSSASPGLFGLLSWSRPCSTCSNPRKQQKRCGPGSNSLAVPLCKRAHSPRMFLLSPSSELDWTLEKHGSSEPQRQRKACVSSRLPSGSGGGVARRRQKLRTAGCQIAER